MKARIPVLHACDDELIPCSRYYEPALTKSGRPWRLELGAAGYELLSALPHSKAVLLPCSDNVATWMTGLPDDLRSRFVTSLASAEALDQLQDKRKFQCVCQALEVPHPRSVTIIGPEDLAALSFGEPGRLFLKPSNSIRFLAAFGTKGVWLSSHEDAYEWWTRCQQIGVGTLVQEYVEGGSDQHYFLDGFRDQHGVVRAVLARRRVRMHPPDFGNSSYCYHISVEDLQPAWHSLQSILDHLRYRGVFSAEFKRSDRDGSFHILEVNARMWVYTDFATVCGANICEMAYRDALDLPVASMAARFIGAGCVNVYDDFCALRAIPRESRPSFVMIAWQWASSYKAVFSWLDPMPALRWFTRIAGQYLQKVFRPNRSQPPATKEN